MIGSFQRWYHPHTRLADEFHSPSTGPIVGEKDGKVAWTSARPGVEFKPIPGAPNPAATPPGRLRQIRELAREFSGRENEGQSNVRDLRLLTQPLLRYEGTETEPVDGALFAFADGTDPDAILLIEARKLDGVLKWQYSLVRMSGDALRMSHRGVEVWNVPVSYYDSHREPFTTFVTENPDALNEAK